MEAQWLGIIAFVVVVVVSMSVWLSFMKTPEEEKVTDIALTTIPKYREGQHLLFLIYTGQLNPNDDVPHDTDLSNFKVLVNKQDGTWDETRLEGEAEPYDIITVALPDDVLSYSVWYDDGRDTYRIIDPRQVAEKVGE